MNNKQYTIRAVPQKLDLFLRSQAKLRGKSLNQTVLDYIEQATKLDMQEDEQNFDWLIGSNTIDQDTLDAIAEHKSIDKEKSRQW